MANNDSQEVIDVEEFHDNLQRKSENSLKKKYHRLKEDTKALETKLNNLSRANDALHRQVFDLTRRQCRVAQLLGFDDFHSVETTIIAEDPWVAGGHDRIRLLEEQVAKHAMESVQEIQAVRAEMEESLKDGQDEAERLRKGRDFARREAERQAADGRIWRDELQVCRNELQRCHDELQKCHDEVQMWRNEVNTRLPEMQALIREQQMKPITQASSPSHAEKENIAGQQEKPDPSPLRDVANMSCCPNNHCTSHDTLGTDVQHYKKKYEILETKYDELLAAKKKVSQRYFQDLKTWKEFKKWIVKEESQSGNTKRRVLKRRKVMEEIGPQDDPPLHDEDVTVPPPPENTGSAEDPNVPLLDLPGEGQNTAAKCFDTNNVLPSNAPQPHSRSPLPFCDSPSRAPFAESLTQPSSVVPASQDCSQDVPTAMPSPISRLSEQLPLSQESVTQPSSTPQSPVREPIVVLPGTLPASSHVKPHTNCINKSLERLSTVLKQEPEEQMLSSDTLKTPYKKQVTNICITSLRSRRNTDLSVDEAPRTHPDALLHRKAPKISLTASEPSLRSRDADTQNAKSGIRRTSTVLAMDTPPRASALVRHHSSPPDSPSTNSSPSAKIKGKRNATDMEDVDGDTDRDHDSDPFVAGPSRSRINSAATQTREKKVTQRKTVGKQSHKEYLAEYMRYKGRGRYSNSTAKTVNADFEIDPTRNGGVAHQFDAVVRDKAKRKTLLAGDCECCRDYYEAIGPMPPRLQPPMWRSPSRSQDNKTSRPCRYQNDGGENNMTPTPPGVTRAKAIESHKQEVSRHRHDWAPPTTPPSYWHIGFPDTQEVESINRQANDMHAHKLRCVEAEASSKNGRYRRRD